MPIKAAKHWQEAGSGSSYWLEAKDEEVGAGGRNRLTYGRKMFFFSWSFNIQWKGGPMRLASIPSRLADAAGRLFLDAVEPAHVDGPALACAQVLGIIRA